MVCVTAFLVLLVSLMVQGNLVDISLEIHGIISAHNSARRAVGAANMLELTWDLELARQASEWSERCHYQRPRAEYNVGSNLYYELDYVYGEESTQAFVTRALTAWEDHQNTYRYGENCGRACSYVQMIFSEANSMGCALSTCTNLQRSAKTEESASLLVCFYSPKTRLMDSLPFIYGNACSQCPRGSSKCVDGLCSDPARRWVSPYPQRRTPYRDITAGRYEDGLTTKEMSSLVSAHNRLRQKKKLETLEWDNYLEKWAKWIVNCTIDFPGPWGTFTNFERLTLGDNVYQAVLDWASEGVETKLKLIHGCRTLGDEDRCNHYTNVLQSALTSMACAARYCTHGTRQLVCLYDNNSERYYYSSSRGTRPNAPRRSNVRGTVPQFDVEARNRTLLERLSRRRLTTASIPQASRDDRRGRVRLAELSSRRPGVYTKPQDRDNDPYGNQNMRQSSNWRRDASRNKRRTLKEFSKGNKQHHDLLNID